LAGGRPIHFLKFDCIDALPHRTRWHRSKFLANFMLMNGAINC
jgi:hypothetical protein